MKNQIVNITADGTWQDITDVPRSTSSICVQARTSAAMSYRFVDQTDLWTIKADTARTLIGEFFLGDIQVQAANGVVIELEYSTKGSTFTG